MTRQVGFHVDETLHERLDDYLDDHALDVKRVRLLVANFCLIERRLRWQTTASTRTTKPDVDFKKKTTTQLIILINDLKESFGKFFEAFSCETVNREIVFVYHVDSSVRSRREDRDKSRVERETSRSNDLSHLSQ